MALARTPKPPPLACALLVLSLAAPACHSSTSRPPNVVLIVADDLGWGEVGCYGQEKIRTPNLDRLASEGMRFTQFYAGAPVCAPSRCALLTGKHTGHAAIRDNLEIQPEGQLALPEAEVTLAEVLRAQGYANFGTGKWGLGGPESEGLPTRQGFDAWFGYLCQRRAQDHYPDSLWRNEERVELPNTPDQDVAWAPDLFIEEALHFVEAQRDQPFFLYLATTLPHLPLAAPAESLAEYRGLWEDPPYDGSMGYEPHSTPRAAYAAMVTRLDAGIGRLVAKIDALGLAEDTLIVFTSDNGPAYDLFGGSDSEFFASSGPFRGYKGSLLEGGLRAPLIARWTGRVPAGATNSTVAAAWDLLPTICELAGATPPDDIDGVSHANVLLGQASAPVHPPLYWEIASYGAQQAVRDGDWKLLRPALQENPARLELYDLASDPGEEHDLAASEPEVVDRLRGLLTSLRSENYDFPLPR